jgi:hypothetical protein
LTYGNLAGCDCNVPRLACHDGIGTGNCQVQPGGFTERVQEYQKNVDAAAALPVDPLSQTVPPECAQWAECAERVIGLDNPESGEFVTQCMVKHKCRMLVRAPAPTKTDTDAGFRSTFAAFSRSDGLNVKGSPTPGRRRCPPGQTQGTTPWSDGCLPQYSKYMRSDRRLLAQKVYVPRMRNLFLASRGFRAMFESGQNAYAARQMHGLKQDLASVWVLIKKVNTHIRNDKRWPTRDRVDEIIGRPLLHVRRILGIDLGEDIKRIGCGWTSTGDLNSLLPNTYPCCGGLWCCIPPPFGDDFYPVKVTHCMKVLIIYRIGSYGETRGTKTPNVNISRQAQMRCYSHSE